MSKKLSPVLAWINQRTKDLNSEGYSWSEAMSMAGKEYRQGGMGPSGRGSRAVKSSSGRGSRATNNSLDAALSKVGAGCEYEQPESYRIEYKPTKRSRIWRDSNVTVPGQQRAEKMATALLGQENWYKVRVVKA